MKLSAKEETLLVKLAADCSMKLMTIGFKLEHQPTADRATCRRLIDKGVVEALDEGTYRVSQQGLDCAKQIY